MDDVLLEFLFNELCVEEMSLLKEPIRELSR